jgi:hypothetical protein
MAQTRAEINERRRLRRLANLEKCRAQDRIRGAHRNREKKLANQRAWRARQHPSKEHEARLQRDFGISLQEYNTLLIDQGGVCAICERPENLRGRQFAVDHCHTSNRVRQLLCDHCNAGLGRFQDSFELLDRAAAYLRRHQPLYTEDV